MTPQQYTIVHLIAALVLVAGGAVSTRIYYKYRPIYGEHVSAIEQIRRLLKDRQPDGYIALASNIIGMSAGVVLFILIFVHR